MDKNIEEKSKKGTDKLSYKDIILMVLAAIELGMTIISLIGVFDYIGDLIAAFLYLLLTVFIWIYFLKKPEWLPDFHKWVLIGLRIFWWVLLLVLLADYILSISFADIFIEKLKDKGVWCVVADNYTPTPTIIDTTNPTTPTQNPSATLIPTLISTPTSTLTPITIVSITPISSTTPTYAPTLKHPNIAVGIFDLGDYFKEENKNKLDELGFNAQLIEFNISVEELQAYDVIYFSSGWCNQIKAIKENNIKLKMESFLSYGKGILIGDPNPESWEEDCSIDFLPVPISYEELKSIQEYDSYDLCQFSPDDDCKTHWIIYEEDIKTFPIPESDPVLPTEDEKFWILTKGINSRIESLVIGSGANKFWVLLPGSEPSSNEKNVGDDIFENIFIWLANDKPVNELEWNVGN